MRDINLNDLEIDESNSCGLLSFCNNNDLYTFRFYSQNGIDTFFDLSKNSNKVIQKHKCKDRIEISCCEIDGTFYFVDTKGKNDLEFSKSLLGSRYKLYFVPSNELPYYNSSESQNPPPKSDNHSSKNYFTEGFRKGYSGGSSGGNNGGDGDWVGAIIGLIVILAIGAGIVALVYNYTWIIWVVLAIILCIAYPPIILYPLAYILYVTWPFILLYLLYLLIFK